MTTAAIFAYSGAAHAQRTVTIGMLNGDGRIDPSVNNASVVLAAAREGRVGDAMHAFVVRGRGTPDLLGAYYSIDPALRRAAAIADVITSGVDWLGLASTAMPMDGFIALAFNPVASSREQSLRMIGVGGSLAPALGPLQGPLPWFACSRDGECLTVHSQLAGVGATVKRFIPSMTPNETVIAQSLGTGTVDENSFDTAFLGGRTVVVWTETSGRDQRSFGRWLAPFPNATVVGDFSLGPGRSPRIACSEEFNACGLIFIAAEGVRAVTILPSTRGLVATSPTPGAAEFSGIDINAIPGGFRAVALFRPRTSAVVNAFGAADWVDGIGGFHAFDQFTVLGDGEFSDLRLTTTTGSDVSLATWKGGNGAVFPYGAIINAASISQDAGVDASADASADATADAADSEAATPVADAAPPADPALRYTGGACNCRVSPAREHRNPPGILLSFGASIAAVLRALRRRAARSQPTR